MRKYCILISYVVLFLTLSCTSNSPSYEIIVKTGARSIRNESGIFDFGIIKLDANSDKITFTIENANSNELKLTGTPESISISGADSAMFFIDQTNIKTSIPQNDSTSFDIIFQPTSLGTKTAEISIPNNSSDKNPYTFTIKGSCVEPYLVVKQNNVRVSSSTGSYDFGHIGLGFSSYNIKFTIENLAPNDIELTGSPKIEISGTDSTMFSVNESNTTSPIKKGMSTTFTISFTPTSLGSKSATITIASDVTDENPFVFDVTGTGYNSGSGTAIGWIGGGSDGWKAGVAPQFEGHDYQSFYFNLCVCTDSSGNIYVADLYNWRICKWSKDGVALGWIGDGNDGWQTTGTVTNTTDYKSFNLPSGVCVDSSGFIYVADRDNHRISKWDSDGNAIGWIGGGSDGWKIGNAPADGRDYQSFDTPCCVCVDSSGNIYVADTANHRICKWNKDGKALAWIGHGSDGWKTTDAPTHEASDYQSFDAPTSVAIDPYDNMYIADTGNNRICKWDKSGNAIGWIGSGSDGWKTSNNPNGGPEYQSFNVPVSVTVNSFGFLYIANAGTHKISKWDIAGNAIGWIGDGKNGWNTYLESKPIDGVDYQSFERPSCVYVDKANRLFISDRNNSRICKWED